MLAATHVQVAVRHGDGRTVTGESVTDVGWRIR